MSPRHIVLYAFVAITARALYPRPLAPHERQKPYEISGLNIRASNFYPYCVPNGTRFIW